MTNQIASNINKSSFVTNKSAFNSDIADMFQQALNASAKGNIKENNVLKPDISALKKVRTVADIEKSTKKHANEAIIAHYESQQSMLFLQLLGKTVKDLSRTIADSILKMQ